MKIAVKRLIRDEKGRAMVMALILLAVGGLITTPLLAYMSTGLIAGQVYEGRTAELYAADAGVEDAAWKIQHNADGVPQGFCDPPLAYNISDVNGKSVDVTITYKIHEDGVAYLIESIATGNGSGTEIEAYLTGTIMYRDLSGVTDHVITCQGEIELSPNTEVNPSEGEHAPAENYDGAWPTPQELEEFYWEDVKDQTPYPSDTIDLTGVSDEEGPLYRDGELDITNSVNPEATLTLTGTLYITGDTLISPTKDLIIDLNGYTIFVASDSSDPQKALWIGGKCTIEGPGAIIAVGDIYFEPQGDVGSNEEPVFVFSVSGTTTLQPGGDFYGSIAGSVLVDLQPGTSLNYPEEGFGTLLDFPSLLEAGRLYGIASWDIKPQ